MFRSVTVLGFVLYCVLRIARHALTFSPLHTSTHLLQRIASRLQHITDIYIYRSVRYVVVYQALSSLNCLQSVFPYSQNMLPTVFCLAHTSPSSPSHVSTVFTQRAVIQQFHCSSPGALRFLVQAGECALLSYLRQKLACRNEG